MLGFHGISVAPISALEAALAEIISAIPPARIARAAGGPRIVYPPEAVRASRTSANARLASTGENPRRVRVSRTPRTVDT